MKVILNGEPRELPDDATVDAAVALASPDRRRGVAAAVDGDVVPRSSWGRTLLREGDRIEIVQAVQGG